MIAEYAAMKALAVAALPSAVPVVDSAMDSDGVVVRGQYVVLFGGGPDSLDDGRLTAPQSNDSDAEYLYTARCVSDTAAGARLVAQRLIGGVVGVRPDVPGRKCSRVKLDGSGPVQTDNNITPPLYFIDNDLLLISRRG